MVIADERGEPSSYALQRLHLCELELRTGGWDEAERLLDEWSEFAERELLLWPMLRALPRAPCRRSRRRRRGGALGDRGDRACGADGEPMGHARGAPRTGCGRSPRRTNRPVRPSSLRTVWVRTEREGVDDPGTFPVAPDLVEALVEAGDLEEARAVTGRLAALSEQQEHPWGLAGARRCAALVRLAGAYDERPAEELRVAAAAYGALGLPFERARSLLALGRAQRRAKKWGDGTGVADTFGRGLRPARLAGLGRRRALGARRGSGRDAPRRPAS